MRTFNIQPIEKSAPSDGSVLDVHSIFYTIQGEGPFTGRPAVFVRLAGCNLQCPSCDTDYTNGRKHLTIEEILYQIQKTAENAAVQPMVVITGGEPFRQNITLLCAALVLNGVTVQIETNGTLAPPLDLQGHYVWANFKLHIVCSPKAGKINQWIEQNAICFKYVLSHDSVAEDGLPILALNHTAKPLVYRPQPSSWRPLIYLQPMDAKDETINNLNIAAVVKSCMKHGYIFQLQTHKYIGVE